MNKNDREFLVQKIRTLYIGKKQTQFDVLSELDAKIKRPANIFSYIFGSVSVVIMGCGISLMMTDIEIINNTMVPGIIISVLGVMIAIINYPVYKCILVYRKKKYIKEILDISKKFFDE